MGDRAVPRASVGIVHAVPRTSIEHVTNQPGLEHYVRSAARVRRGQSTWSSGARAFTLFYLDRGDERNVRWLSPGVRTVQRNS